MSSYIARRISLALVILLGVTLISFFLTRIIPSDPAMLWVGRFATQKQIDKARELLGLNRPWYVQYAKYLEAILHGDLGVSIRTHAPVTQELAERLPASLGLVIAGMILGLTVGLALGMVAAAKPGSPLDQAARFFGVAGVALPQFWFAMILQLVFAKMLHLLPLVGQVDMRLALFHPIAHVTGFNVLDALITGNWIALKDAILHLVLPAVTLAAYPIGMSARLIRAKMLEVLGEDYIRTARAFGASEFNVFMRRALRNAVGPVLTLSAISFVYTLVGTFMVETIFAWPGIGSYTATAILSNDVSVILAVTLLIAAFTVVFNLLVDLALAWLDPRIRLE